MKKKHLSILLFTAATLTAEHGYSDAGPDCCINSCECCPGPYTTRLTARHREPGGIGYDQGYTSLDLFWAPNLGNGWYSFVDARGHVFNDGKWATNLGIGLRFLPECYDVVVGGNFYWDWRQTKHTHFNQLGAGLEFLWPCWDIRVNGYFPVGHDKKLYRNGFDGFKGNEALTFKKWELALWGVDAALGYWLFQGDCFGLHAAIGGYYFDGDFNKHAGGGLLRAKMQFWDWVELRGQVSYDNLFKWQGYGELVLNLPFGCRVSRYPRQTNCCPTILSLEERLVEQPERFEIIVTTTHKKTCRAISPLTGEPLHFIFVDNTAGSTGTFEDPFPTLLEAQNASVPGDVIYVFPGDGTDNGMNLGITLKDDQILTSSFLSFDIFSSCGDFVIPALSDTRPKISNDGDVVKVANRNTVQGFEITGTTGGVVALQPITDLTIFNNIINVNNSANEEAHGVRFDQSFNGRFLASNNQISVVALEVAKGIEFASVQGELLISGNTISATSQTSTATAILAGTTAPNSFIGQINLNNNIISSISDLGSFGILAFNLNGSFLSNNDVVSATSNSGSAFGLEIDASTGTVSVTGGSISATSNSNIAFGITLANFTGEFIITNNDISAISDSNFVIAIDSAGSFSGTFLANDNVITATSGMGSAGGITFNGTFSGDLSALSNTINATSSTNTADGFSFFNNFNGTSSLVDNIITVNGSSAVGWQSAGQFNGDFTAQGNMITAIGSTIGTGIAFVTFIGSFVANENEITAQQSAAITLGNVLTSTISITDNILNQPTNSAFFATLRILGLNMNPTVIQDNTITSQATDNRAFFMENSAFGTSHLKLFDNILSSPAFTDDGRFENLAGTFEVESTDGAITGVEGLNNNARLTDNGAVTYVPFTP